MKRVRACGRVRRAKLVGLRVTGGVAGYAGLVTCGSVWACPVCSRKIAARRALEVGAVVAAAIAEGYVVVLMTLTLRHRLGQGLTALWDAVSACWAAGAVNGKAAGRVASQGLVGFVRSTEVTHGGNGWHPHTHALLILEPGTTDAEIDELCEGILTRWSNRAEKLGLERPLVAGQDWQRVGAERVAAVAEYVAKTHKEQDPAKVGLELTWSQSKRARSAHGTRSMWEVLEGAAMLGDAADVRTWGEWERSSKGRRAMAWSHGLRERFALRPEKSDEDIAAEALGTEADTIVWITPVGWDLVVATPGLPAQLLAAAEDSPGALRKLLHAHGVDYTVWP